MSKNNLEFILTDFICSRCGCTLYDKVIYTGNKTLEDDDSIIYEEYRCRNCNKVININKQINDKTISMSKEDLLDQSKFINNGIKYTNNYKGD